MYIEASYYNAFSTRSLVNPRERYIRYYRDLHDRYKIVLDEATLLEGSQYRYNELAYPIFDKLVKDGMLKKIDTMVVTHWAHEFDPDHATLGPHLAHRYDFSCNMFDVLDQGSICAMTSLSLIKKLNTKKSLCLSLDQTTVPRSDSSSFSIPTKTASVALCLSTDKPEKPSIKIVDIEILAEKVLCDSKLNLVQIILECLSKNNIDISECVLSCKRNSTVYRAINLYQHQYKNFLEEVEFNFLPVELGCTELFQFIHLLSLTHKNLEKRYYLYLDEDVESLTAGFIILEIPLSYGAIDNAMSC